MSNKSNKIFRIYKCTNIVNGKKYIGFTNKELKKRKILSDAIKLMWQKRKQSLVMGVEN